MMRLLFAVTLAIVGPSAANAAATECVGPRTVLRSSQLAGHVFLREGVPFPGARVTVTSFGRDILDIPTDDRGYFEAPGVTGRGRVRVSALGFESVEIPWEINPRLPFQLIAAVLDIGMTCGSRACLVMLPSPGALGRFPKCLGTPGRATFENPRPSRPVLDPSITSQEALTQAATSHPDPQARLAAAAKLDDRLLAQRIYEEVARTPGYGRWLWGDQAVRELTDQTLLAQFALTDPLFSVRVAAVDRLTDQALLARLAQSDHTPWIRMIAASKLTDRGLLSRIARSDSDWWVRQAAHDRLKHLRR